MYMLLYFSFWCENEIILGVELADCKNDQRFFSLSVISLVRRKHDPACF